MLKMIGHKRPPNGQRLDSKQGDGGVLFVCFFVVVCARVWAMP